MARPENFDMGDTLDILLDMERNNIDGFGFVYLRDGEFVVRKWPRALHKVLKRDKRCLDELKNVKGWTLFHMRAASHGCNCDENTHPFITPSGNYSIIHNGIFSDYGLAKLCMPQIQFHGDTDSEVAAAIIDVAGVKAFSDEIDMSGVFMCLHKTGTLYVIKTSGDCCATQLENKTCLVSSQLAYGSYPQRELLTGYYVFNKDCRYVKHHEKKDKWTTRFKGWYNENEVFIGGSNPTKSDKSLLPYHFRKTYPATRQIDKIEITNVWPQSHD